MISAYGDLNLAISVDANTKEEMEKKLMELHTLGIYSLTLETLEGKLITVKVHDYEIEWEDWKSVEGITA